MATFGYVTQKVKWKNNKENLTDAYFDRDSNLKNKLDIENDKIEE